MHCVVSDQKILRRYENRVKKSSITICCDCQEIMKVGKYPRHHCLFTHHGKRNVCPWACHGQVSWMQGEKMLHADHLIECFKRFVKDHKFSKKELAIMGTSTGQPCAQWNNDEHLRFNLLGDVPDQVEESLYEGNFSIYPDTPGWLKTALENSSVKEV